MHSAPTGRPPGSPSRTHLHPRLHERNGADGCQHKGGVLQGSPGHMGSRRRMRLTVPCGPCGVGRMHEHEAAGERQDTSACLHQQCICLPSFHGFHRIMPITKKLTASSTASGATPRCRAAAAAAPEASVQNARRAAHGACWQPRSRLHPPVVRLGRPLLLQFHVAASLRPVVAGGSCVAHKRRQLFSACWHASRRLRGALMIHLASSKVLAGCRGHGRKARSSKPKRAQRHGVQRS